MPNAERIAQVFKVLSVSTRVRIIQLLRHRPHCVNALAHTLNLTPAAISQHLRVLRDAGLVVADKHGYFVHYRLNCDTVARCHRAADDLLRPDTDNTTAHASHTVSNDMCGTTMPCTSDQRRDNDGH